MAPPFTVPCEGREARFFVSLMRIYLAMVKTPNVQQFNHNIK